MGGIPMGMFSCKHNFLVRLKSYPTGRRIWPYDGQCPRVLLIQNETFCPGKLSDTRNMANEANEDKNQGMDYKKLAILGAAGATTAVIAAPLVVSGIGFGSAGISAGSYAASWMSAAALAGGGGVVKGSTIAILQSVGAAGM